MKIFQIKENKLCELADVLEEALCCVNELKEEGYGERNTYGMRARMGYREDDWGGEAPVMSHYGERRMRNRYGRFI